MLKLTMIAFVLAFIEAAAAIASPPALTRGHWSLGFEADRNVNVSMGYGIASLTRLIVNGSVVSPGNVIAGGRDLESTASISVGIVLQRYLSWASSDRFAPFLGGGAAFTATGVTSEEVNVNGNPTELRFDPGDVYSVNGRFGVEFFPWEPISISGHVGITADMHSEGEVVDLNGFPIAPREVDLGNDVYTFSALFVTFYWGGD